MPLLRKLKEVRTTKGQYFSLQRRFYAEFSKRYPYLMKYDMTNIARKLETELQLLLCSALKYKSVTIKVPGKPDNHRCGGPNDHVCIARSMPGFYNPGSERGHSDYHHMDMNLYYNDDDDLFEKETDKQGLPKDICRIQMSKLRDNDTQVTQERLEVYFKLAKEVMAYRPNMICMIQVSIIVLL